MKKETKYKKLDCIRCENVWEIKERVVRTQKLTRCPKCTAYNLTARAV